MLYFRYLTMKIKIINKFTTVVSVMTLAAVFLFSGCGKDYSKEIKDLGKRVSSLEQAATYLQHQLDQGSLVRSVTEIPNGWRIEFVGGLNPVATLDIILPSGHSGGAMPQFEVRRNPNGTTTLWVNTGSGWEDTKVDLRGPAGTGGGGTGPQGPTGPAGPQGSAGADGITPQLDVRENADGTITIWISYDEGDTWEDTEVDLKAVIVGGSPLLAIYDDSPVTGTVTFVLNDVDFTELTFYKAYATVDFELAMVESEVLIPVGGTGTVTFRVNPSNAPIPTDLSKWELDELGTRGASYVTPSANFELLSIVPDGAKEGQYIATIKNLGENESSTIYEAKIGSVYYQTFREALVAVKDGETITLLKDVEYRDNGGIGIYIDGINITFELNGYNLNVVTSSNHDDATALYVCNGGVLNLGSPEKYVMALVMEAAPDVFITSPTFPVKVSNSEGEFNVESYMGVYVTGAGSVATVTNVIATWYQGVYADGGGTVTVLGDVVSELGYGVMAWYYGSTVTVGGNVTAAEIGVLAAGDAVVTVHGNVVGGFGVQGMEGVVVTVKGEIIATRRYIYLVDYDYNELFLAAADYDLALSLANTEGYLVYTDGTNYVYVTGTP